MTVRDSAWRCPADDTSFVESRGQLRKVDERD
jgi:hypothetical protein